MAKISIIDSDYNIYNTFVDSYYFIKAGDPNSISLTFDFHNKKSKDTYGFYNFLLGKTTIKGIKTYSYDYKKNMLSYNDIDFKDYKIDKVAYGETQVVLILSSFTE